MSMRAWVGNPTRLVFFVIIAMMVFVRRAFSPSSCTTRAGLNFEPEPEAKGKSTRTTSPLLRWLIAVVDVHRGIVPALGRRDAIHEGVGLPDVEVLLGLDERSDSFVDLLA